MNSQKDLRVSHLGPSNPSGQRQRYRREVVVVNWDWSLSSNVYSGIQMPPFRHANSLFLQLPVFKVSSVDDVFWCCITSILLRGYRVLKSGSVGSLTFPELLDSPQPDFRLEEFFKMSEKSTALPLMNKDSMHPR